MIGSDMTIRLEADSFWLWLDDKKERQLQFDNGYEGDDQCGMFGVNYFFALTTIIFPVASRGLLPAGMDVRGLVFVFLGERIVRWESGKPGFGFPLFHPLRRRPVGNVGIAQRFPRAVESGVCFPSVRHFHRQWFYSVAASVFAFLACSTR
jgi:hypothetical protein